jgi:hypothetical protein
MDVGLVIIRNFQEDALFSADLTEGLKAALKAAQYTTAWDAQLILAALSDLDLAQGEDIQLRTTEIFSEDDGSGLLFKVLPLQLKVVDLSEGRERDPRIALDPRHLRDVEEVKAIVVPTTPEYQAEPLKKVTVEEVKGRRVD